MRLTPLFMPVCFFCTVAQAVDQTWNQTGGGAWETATNWTPNGVPGSTTTDTVNLSNSITAASEITVNGTYDIIDLEISSGFGYTLSDSGSATLNMNNAITASTANGDAAHIVDVPIAMQSTLTLNVDTTNPLTVSGVISENRMLNKAGPGTAILSGVNTFVNVISITGGTLSISSANNLGNSANVVEISDGTTLATTADMTQPNSVVIFNGTTGTIDVTTGTTLTLQGAITGASGASSTGSLTKAGDGTLILGSSSNDYSGGTTISAGTLQGTTATILGNVANSGALVFNQSSDGTYAGTLSGAGTFTKSGAGKLTVSATSASFTGSTTISGGELHVTGSLANTSGLSVGAGATLSGTGIVGSTTNNSTGTVSPGASIGTLTIDGDYLQGADATYYVEIEPGGTSDLLDISGTATLAGTVRLEPNVGVYTLGTVYTILTADGGISGTFDSLVEFHPLQYTLSYSANSVFLNIVNTAAITQSNLDPSIRLNFNQKSMQNYLFDGSITTSSADLTLVMNELLALPLSAYKQALEQLNSAVFGAQPLMRIQSDTLVASTFSEKTRQILRCSPSGKRFFWIEPLGFYYSQNKKEQLSQFNGGAYGVAVGGTQLLEEGWNVNYGVAYTRSSLNWSHHLSKGHANSLYLCPSIGWQGNRFYGNLLALASLNHYSMRRGIDFGTINRTARSHYTSWDLVGAVEGGTLIPIRSTYIQLNAALTYLNMFEPKIEETGANSVNLRVNPKYTAFLRPEFTVGWFGNVIKKDRCISPNIYAGWARDGFLTGPTYTAKFEATGLCGCDFKTHSFNKSRGRFVWGAGVVSTSGDTNRFSLEYEANISPGYQVQKAKLRFEKKF